MRQTREATVRTIGVKMQAKRPSLPILTVGDVRYSIKQCRGRGSKLVDGLSVGYVDGSNQTSECRVGRWMMEVV